VAIKTMQGVLGVRMRIDEALKKAKQLISQNDIVRALDIYRAILTRVPDHKEAVRGFVTLSHAQQTNAPVPAQSEPNQSEPNQAEPNFTTAQAAVESLISQYNQAATETGSERITKLEAVIIQTEKVQTAFPNIPFFANLIGIVNADLTHYEKAIQAFEAAIALKPDYADALNNLANALQNSGQFIAAINAYAQALTHDPTNAITMSNLASAFQESGDLQAALDTYVKAAQLQPDSTHAYINIATLTGQMGDLDTALSAYMKVLQLNPTDWEVHNNIGVIYSQKSDFQASIAAYEKAIELQPTYAEAYNNLGASLKALGNMDAAISAFHRAVEINPDYADAFNNLGVALKNSDKLDEAIIAYQRAIHVAPNRATFHNNLGNALQSKGQTEAAIQEFATAVQLTPNYATFHNNLGNALRDKHDFNGAIKAFHKAIELDPDYAEAYNNLGITLRGKFDTVGALAAHHKALELDSERPSFLNSLGNALNESGNSLAALEAYRKALDIRPDYIEALKNIGIVLKDRGDFAAARDAFKKILAIKPLFAEGTRAIAAIANDDDLEYLDHITNRILETVEPNTDPWMHASLARSEMHHRNKNFAEAFKLLDMANQYRRTSLNYNLRVDKDLFTNIRNQFATPPLAAIATDSEKTDPQGQQRPIFILGMPRSGTSLVEQVISSHTMVSGYGELEWLRLAILENDGLHQPMDTTLLARIRAAYYGRLESHNRSDTQFFTDKMPTNFLWIGYILAAFPEAKIVHVERDPMAVCWSNFKTYFHSLGMGNSFDQRDIAGYFGLYQKLMEFWRRAYPNKIFDLSYENLTEDTQAQTQTLLEYLGLPWQASVMEPHKNARPVRTASSKQVRNEIYKGSSDAWRHYEAWLQPMMEALNYRSD
jgi:tetratricopeptide (TPR) repeat protein